MEARPPAHQDDDPMPLSLTQLVHDNDTTDYVDAFSRLARLELDLRAHPPDFENLAKRAHLQAALGDHVGAYNTSCHALELRPDLDLILFKARCGLNIALCLSGVEVFPHGRVPQAGAVTVREALEESLRDCEDAAAMGPLDDESLALAQFLVDLLDGCDDERRLVRRLRELGAP